MPRFLTLRPTAKINWSLRVGRRHDDGYHDVRTILQSIDLSDTMEFKSTSGPFELISKSTEVPADATNLVWRAARALWHALDRAGDPKNVRIRLTKAIPVGAGLGGGSADAAAALVGLNRMWNGGLSRPELIRIGADLGADVPFFLTGGTGLGLGLGDEVYPLADIKRVGLVLLKPSFSVRTADAYGWFDADGDVPSVPASTTELGPGWGSGPLEIANDLQGPVARRHPLINEAIDACRRAGAVTAAMTGSGSAVFGVFSMDQRSRAARRLQGPDWQVFATRTLSRAEAGRRIAL